MNSVTFKLERNAFGRLVFIGPDGVAQVGVTPVRAFPIAAPDEGLSLVGPDGHELAWLEHLHQLPAAERQLVDEELAVREFRPVIQRLVSVSSFATPSTWIVETDRGPTRLVLKAEEDIRRLGAGRLLVSSGQGVAYLIPNMAALDRVSRKLLERFL